MFCEWRTRHSSEGIQSLSAKMLVGRRPESLDELKGMLLTAATCGNKRNLDALLKKCKNITRTAVLQDQSYIDSLLSRALMQGHVHIAILLEKSYHVSIGNFLKTDSEKCNLLCKVLQSKHQLSVFYLLSKGASIFKLCQSHESPLTLACSFKNVDLVDRLVKMGAGLDGKVEPRITPLMAAIHSRSVEVVQYLLQKGANVNKHALNGTTALHTAVQCWGSIALKLVHELLQHNAVLKPNQSGNTPLMLAASLGKVEIVGFFLDRLSLSKEDRVNALELCGASLVQRDWDRAAVFDCLQKAMEERYSDLSNVLHKRDLLSLPELGYFVESQSLSEISERRDDDVALLMECLAIRKRLARNEHNYIFYWQMLHCLFDHGHHRELIRLLKYDPDITSYIMNKYFMLYRENSRLGSNNPELDVKLNMMCLDACITRLKHCVENSKDIPYPKSAAYPFLDHTVWYLGICIHQLGEGLVNAKYLEDETSRILQCISIDPRPIYSPLNMAILHWLKYRVDDEKKLYEDLIKFLVEHKAPLDCIDYNGDASLHILARSNKPGACDLVRLLLVNDADLDIHDQQGRTPAQVAVTNEMKTLLHSVPRRLMCIATHTILECNMDVKQLPVPLQMYVRYHIHSHAERNQVMRLDEVM